MDLSKAFSLIRQFEGIRLHAYQDSVGVWTIGYGSTTIAGKKVFRGQAITLAQAEAAMEADVKARAASIMVWLGKRVPTGNQVSAMISLAYNIGMGAFHISHLLVDWKGNGSLQACGADFMHFIFAGGKRLQGLVNRRNAEVAIFLS